ncbi:MAG: 16S rRNA (cytosine(1402)-N(4))-methyltransferase RsmH [Bdellovibrionales bacterium]
MNSSQLHKPVLLDEVLKAFGEHFALEDGPFGVDGTFGRGGHASAILESYPKVNILGVDQDLEAIEYAKSQYKDYLSNERLNLLHANFSDSEKVKEALNRELNFVFLDIGVSSPQLDNAERGFSFYNDGPLDMRMNQAVGETAADVVNEKDSEELRALFLEYGEVYASDKLLEGITDFKNDKKFETTLELANLIEKKCGWRKKGVHPATLYFQALRIYVNAELDKLQEALEFYTESLAPGGVFMIISFHSLEDRMIKQFFKSSTVGKPVNKKVIKPTREEETENKRSRSAKLRVFKKN